MLLLQAKLPCPQKSMICCLPAMLLWSVQALLNVRRPQQAAMLHSMLPACHAALVRPGAAQYVLAPASCQVALQTAVPAVQLWSFCAALTVHGHPASWRFKPHAARLSCSSALVKGCCACLIHSRLLLWTQCRLLPCSSGSLRCCEMASLAMLASLHPSER